MASSPSLTTHLLSLSPSSLQKATTHPFLALAATRQLPSHTLKSWLAQDRLYALSYIPFIGSLLTHLPIPTSPDREETLHWKIADALIDCLANIRREIRLFEDTARKEGFLGEICEGVEEGRVTRCYGDLFAGAVGAGRGILGGLVVLWATEECYLRAWKGAREMVVSYLEGANEEEEGDVMQRVFIPNWSSQEFEQFVGTLRGLVDELAVEMGVLEGSWEMRECEAAWKQVLWCEEMFWPDC